MICFVRSCDGNIPNGCINLGRLYETGSESIKVDLNHAVDLYKKACRLNSSIGCTSLGYMYDLGLGVDKNVVKARNYYEIACAGEDPRGCNNLGNIYELGDGVPKDEARAFYYTERACEEPYSVGCRSLAKMYLHGNSVVRQDEKHALEHFRTACEREDEESCIQRDLLAVKLNSGRSREVTDLRLITGIFPPSTRFAISASVSQDRHWS